MSKRFGFTTAALLAALTMVQPDVASAMDRHEFARDDHARIERQRELQRERERREQERRFERDHFDRDGRR